MQPATSPRPRSRLPARSARRASSRCSSARIARCPSSKVSSALRDLFLHVRLHRALIHARGAFADPGAIAAEDRPQQRIRRAAQFTQGVDAGRFHPRSGLAPKAGQAAHRQGVEHLADLLRRHHGQAVGLLQLRGDLRHQLVGRDADRGGESGELADAALDAARDLGAAAEQRGARGDIQERLIERQALHQRGDLAEHAEHQRRDFLVALHARTHAHRVGAQAQRLAHRHGGAHAKAAHFVAGRGHDAAAAAPADDHRQAGERGIVVLLDGRVERVHVDMQHRACHGVALGSSR